MNSATSQHSTSQDVSIDAQQEKKVCFPVRYRIAAMAFAGMTIEHAIRMSVAMSAVAMVNSTSSSQSTEYNNDYTCPADGATANSTLNANSGGKFNWNSQEQALVLGDFNYGYVFSLFPGALLVAKFGGRKMFIIALLITGFLNLLGPILAETNVILLIISRALTGIGGLFLELPPLTCHTVATPVATTSSAKQFSHQNGGKDNEPGKPVSSFMQVMDSNHKDTSQRTFKNSNALITFFNLDASSSASTSRSVQANNSVEISEMKEKYIQKSKINRKQNLRQQ